MDNTIIVALIGLVGTIASAAISAGWFKSRNLRFYNTPDEAKRKKLEGTWTGKQQQAHGPAGTPIEYDTALDIHWSGKIAKGKYRFTYNTANGTIDETLPFRGGFMYGRFLKLNYYDNTSGKTQFGALILELDENAAELKGMDLGFGYTTKDIVSSHLSLHKVV